MAHLALKVFTVLWIGLIASAAALCGVPQAQAQDASGGAGEQQSQAEAAEQNRIQDDDNEDSMDEQAGTDQRPDLDSQPLETPADQTPGRFIPSEQISLDLGVSFPVDI